MASCALASNIVARLAASSASSVSIRRSHSRIARACASIESAKLRAWAARSNSASRSFGGLAAGAGGAATMDGASSAGADEALLFLRRLATERKEVDAAIQRRLRHDDDDRVLADAAAKLGESLLRRLCDGDHHLVALDADGQSLEQQGILARQAHERARIEPDGGTVEVVEPRLLGEESGDVVFGCPAMAHDRFAEALTRLAALAYGVVDLPLLEQAGLEEQRADRLAGPRKRLAFRTVCVDRFRDEWGHALQPLREALSASGPFSLRPTALSHGGGRSRPTAVHFARSKSASEKLVIRGAMLR